MVVSAERPSEQSASRPKKRWDQTRQEILAAAADRFGKSGYRGVRLKDIAGDVGITAAMVVRYFGTKEALFREVAMSETEPPLFSADLKGPLESLGYRLAKLVVSSWLDSSIANAAAAMIRSLDFEEAKSLFAAEWERRLIAPLAEVLQGADADMKARLIGSQIMGVGLFGLNVLVDLNESPGDDPMQIERLISLLGAAIQAVIDNRDG